MTTSITRALISVSDKTGIVDFARELASLGIELISTGGTARTLREAGLTVKDVSDLTGFPEMMDGRVKTLHPRIHGGILQVRSNPEHQKAASQHGVVPIDLVCVNLYPFRETVSRAGVTVEEAIENIDIGGPSMVRSAAKNFRDVVVLVEPDDYARVLEAIKQGGEVPFELRAELATRAFQHTAAYDAAISAWMADNLPQQKPQDVFPSSLVLSLERHQSLRYGENPHQSAAFYRNSGFHGVSLTNAQQLGGKELSYNNIVDLDAAMELILEFDTPACAIIKHTNPCGLATRSTLAEAFSKAREGDPISAFGGIIAVNRPVDVETAEAITGPQTFFEAILATDFSEDALPILKEKKKWGANLRLLRVDLKGARPRTVLKNVAGGLLVQTADLETLDESKLSVPTKRPPTEAEWEQLRFAWKAVKHVKSNAIVLVRDLMLIGVGAGQMNRVGSVKIAAEQAGEKSKGCVLASDAFFPKSDGPEEAARAGVTAIIQPGGSVEDPNVIAVADANNMAMVFTGLRHFRH